MQHLDEHILELYILGSDLVKERADEIKAHLKECCGCRSLAERIERLYRDAEASLQASEDYIAKKDHKSNALMRINKEIEQYYDPFASPVPYQTKSALGKFFYFVRKHPVAVSMGSFAMFAIVGWLLNDFIKTDTNESAITDKNPSYPNLNTESAIVEIYNKENQLLWGIPSRSIYRLSTENYTESINRINIIDLNGDKNNEVVSILPFGNSKEYEIPLSIMSPEGRLLKEIFFREDVRFRGTKYDASLTSERLISVDSLESGKPEIIVVSSSGRSPIIINRLSHEGAILGQYYHFGGGNVKYIRSGEDYKIVFLGQNDTGEPDSLSFAVMSIIDPEKLVGKQEASDSRGFNLERSRAEIFLIRFPFSDMNILWNTHATASNLKETTIGAQKIYSVWISGIFGSAGLGTGPYPTFEYIFNEKMEIVEVRYNSSTLRLRGQYMAKGQLTGTIDQAYLDNLKDGVKYWNGTSWQSEPTTVGY